MRLGIITKVANTFTWMSSLLTALFITYTTLRRARPGEVQLHQLITLPSRRKDSKAIALTLMLTHSSTFFQLITTTDDTRRLHTTIIGYKISMVCSTSHSILIFARLKILGSLVLVEGSPISLEASNDQPRDDRTTMSADLAARTSSKSNSDFAKPS
jgi:hypothetical protein